MVPPTRQQKSTNRTLDQMKSARELSSLAIKNYAIYLGVHLMHRLVRTYYVEQRKVGHGIA